MSALPVASPHAPTTGFYACGHEHVTRHDVDECAALRALALEPYVVCGDPHQTAKDAATCFTARTKERAEDLAYVVARATKWGSAARWLDLQAIQEIDVHSSFSVVPLTAAESELVRGTYDTALAQAKAAKFTAWATYPARFYRPGVAPYPFFRGGSDDEATTKGYFDHHVARSIADVRIELRTDGKVSVAKAGAWTRRGLA